MPTLKSIEAQYRGDVDQCLMECLTLWLQRKDNARLPSWISLASALNEIDEKAVFEKIIEISKTIELVIIIVQYFVDKQLTDPASQILQKYSDRLSQVTLPVQLCQQLLTEKVITKEVLDEIKAFGHHLVNGSFRALRYTVCRDHNQLCIFAAILLKSEDTISIATDIISDYSKPLILYFTYCYISLDQVFPSSPLVSNLNNTTTAGNYLFNNSD